MLFAYAGGPSTFPQQREDLTHLATADAVIFSDGDLETWELASVDFALPLGTDFVGIEVIAGENIFNNVSTGPEYDGHFADDVVVTLTTSTSPAIALTPATSAG